MRRSIKTALRYYKKELREFLQLFMGLEGVGAPQIFVPRDLANKVFSWEARLAGMREVLGIKEDDLKRIYKELGVQYEVHLNYSPLFTLRSKGEQRYEDQAKK